MREKACVGKVRFSRVERELGRFFGQVCHLCEGAVGSASHSQVDRFAACESAVGKR